MLSDLHFKTVENAHHEMKLRFEKARANRDKEGIKRAEMDYFHALQHLYAAVRDPVSDPR